MFNKKSLFKVKNYSKKKIFLKKKKKKKNFINYLINSKNDLQSIVEKNIQLLKITKYINIKKKDVIFQE